MTSAGAESWDTALRKAAQGAAQAGVETLHGARPPLVTAQSARAVSSLILAAFVCAAALFRARLAPGQLDLIASALRVIALAFVVRALLDLARTLAQALADRRARGASLALGPDGLYLRVGQRGHSVRRAEILGVSAAQALPSRTLAPRPEPVSLVLTPQNGLPRVLRVPPYFAQTSDILSARLERWLTASSAGSQNLAEVPEAVAVAGPLAQAGPASEEPELRYARAAAGQRVAGDVVIPEGRRYLLRAPYSALLGLCFALDVFYSAGPSRALIATPALAACLLSLAAFAGWFVWMGRLRQSRLGIGMLLTPRELLLRGPRGTLSVPWAQLADAEVQSSARWSPFSGAYAARVLTLTTHAGERILFDESFLGVPIELVAALCAHYRGGPQ